MTGPFEKIFDSEEFREEFFVSQVQAKLAALLEDKGVSRAELARKLDVSRPRVTQIFSDDAKNLTLRLIFRSYAALGEEPILLPKSEYMRLLKKCEALGSPAGGSDELNSNDFFTRGVIADSLRALIGTVLSESDKSSRKPQDFGGWAEADNVFPITEAKRA